MKKLLAVLFYSLVMAGAAFADELSYEIDPVATAKARWKLGDVIIKTGNCQNIKYFRKFLGVTQSGFALVQDFYPNGEMRTSPFLTILAKAGKNSVSSCQQGVEGLYTLWYTNGQKKSETNLKNGEVDSFIIWWYENGQKKLEFTYTTDGLGFYVTEWYENGQKQRALGYKNNEKEGPINTWYENGQKEREASYKNGKETGMWRFWDEKGNLIEEKNYGTPEG